MAVYPKIPFKKRESHRVGKYNVIHIPFKEPVFRIHKVLMCAPRKRAFSRKTGKI